MDEASLKAKLARIAALFEGAKTEGERTAAANARVRIQSRLEELLKDSPPIEYRFTLTDMWSRRLLVALARRHGLAPYRYSGQRLTTVMLRVSKAFVDETLWPEFLELEKALRAHLDEITERVIREAVHGDASEAVEQPAPKQLKSGT